MIDLSVGQRLLVAFMLAMVALGIAALGFLLATAWILL